jgi:hypothetical protein
MMPGGLALVLVLSFTSASDLPLAAAVRVGVVLDLTSEAGRKSLTCISMAWTTSTLRMPTPATGSTCTCSWGTRVEMSSPQHTLVRPALSSSSSSF